MSETTAPEAQVFPDDAWTRATFCGPNGGNCVEVNRGVPGIAGVRDSKAGAGPALVFAGQQWTAFLATVRPARSGD
ncbi:MAG TPA: DUF397 domain-containing protein [Pseudonocardiaceae bacterium]|jgi:hypothetical protein|nr:DUF397 domain-containing protein [Pseudonocardiaceae bacterium]